MKLGTLDFPIDDYASLPYRDLIDLRDVLKSGLASPFWTAYGEIVDGMCRNLEKGILAPLAQPSLDLAFSTEFLRGQLAATRTLGVTMATLLSEVQAQIDTLQAQQENPENVRRDSPESNASP